VCFDSSTFNSISLNLVDKSYELVNIALWCFQDQWALLHKIQIRSSLSSILL
jgi:hypothetical protein